MDTPPSEHEKQAIPQAQPWARRRLDGTLVNVPPGNILDQLARENVSTRAARMLLLRLMRLYKHALRRKRRAGIGGRRTQKILDRLEDLFLRLPRPPPNVSAREAMRDWYQRSVDEWSMLTADAEEAWAEPRTDASWLPR